MVARALRLIHQGEISKAGKALESLGLGDFSDPAVFLQMQEKHPARQKPIDDDIFDYEPDADMIISLGDILR